MFVKQVIGLRDVIPPPLRREFNDVYIAMELMDTDLHHIIRSNQNLSDEHCQVSALSCLLLFIDSFKIFNVLTLGLIFFCC